MKATTERPARECLILARRGLLDVWKEPLSSLAKACQWVFPAVFDNFSAIVARAAANAKSVLRGDALPETDVVVAPGRKVPVA